MKLERLLLSLFLASTTPALAQQSAAILDAPVCVVDTRHHFETLLDLNGDAFPDVVALNMSSGGIGAATFVNDGTGRLVGAGAFSASGSYNENTPAHVRVCDVNHDGLDDMYLVVASTVGHIYVLVTNPGGWFAYDYFQTYDGSLIDARLHDFDGDGTLDRARLVGSTLHVDRMVWNPTTSSYDVTTASMSLGFAAQEILLLDCDGDSHLDIYAHGDTQSKFVPMTGAVPGTPIPLVHGITSPMPMAIPGDVDGDGDEDLSIFDMTGYAIVRRTGPASWSPEPRRVGGPAARFADVDGDGDLDGVCCGGGGSYDYYFSKPSTFRISINDGAGNFAPAFTFPGMGSREIAGAADMDGDGDVDLVAGNCIYWGRGPLTGPPQTPIVNGEQSRQSTYDFDRDGDPDFTPGAGTFQRNLGDASSHAYDAHLPAPPAGSTFEGPGLPGDFDGDGDPDLLVRVRTAGVVTSMRFLSNEGGGTYADGGDAGAVDFLPSAVAGTRPENSFTHDVDLDGDLDLVTFVRSAPGSVWGRTLCWRNDGMAHFALAWNFPEGWALGLGAFTGGDAWPDIVIARFGSGQAFALPGAGNGTFSTTSALSLYLGDDVGPASLAIADFDADGDDDLVIAAQFGGYGWYSGTGYFIPAIGGTLSLNDKVVLDALENESSSSSVGPTPRIAHAADVDGDGLLDAILSCPSRRRAAISIVRRSPDNTGWLPPVRQVVYDAASGVDAVARVGSLADVDGDGDADYVTDVLWRNLTRVPPDGGARRQTSSGWPDANGIVPTLGAIGPFRVGLPAEIRLTGAPGGMSGVMIDSYAVDPLPFGSGPMHIATQVRIAAQVPFVTNGVAGVPACGEWHLPFTVPGYVAGRTKNYTAVMRDPTLAWGEVRSNVLTISYGP